MKLRDCNLTLFPFLAYTISISLQNIYVFIMLYKYGYKWWTHLGQFE